MTKIADIFATLLLSKIVFANKKMATGNKAPTKELKYFIKSKDGPNTNINIDSSIENRFIPNKRCSSSGVSLKIFFEYMLPAIAILTAFL
ncbi:MAG: hypothetical protein PHC54_00635 [Candidatus Omnitrophica bacterium]|nr:hypothetical protein [Candidatus Omnitrophota bacterium]MDD5591916.1 hypothetical protein [Candidatus Omnitrophota bacterium]